MRIVTIVGARPQFIKAAALSRAIRSHQKKGADVPVEKYLVHTGQHYDSKMSDVFFEELNIPRPSINLGIGGGTHGKMTGQMLVSIEEILQEQQPDWTIVFGDTNSTVAGALAAAKLHLPVAHVEAGLRSYDKRMPEEINRVLTDHLSQKLFCPSTSSVENLAREGITEGVELSGDVMVDVVRFHADQAPACPFKQPFILATIHRAENTDDPSRLQAILNALDIAPHEVIFPIHPRTKNRLSELGLQLPGRVNPIEPLSYLEMIAALKACEWVITDSGGLQKEACLLGKKCAVMRDRTEWVELVDADAVRLVDVDLQAFREAAEWAAERLENVGDIYGDGKASERILRSLLQD